MGTPFLFLDYNEANEIANIWFWFLDLYLQGLQILFKWSHYERNFRKEIGIEGRGAGVVTEARESHVIWTVPQVELDKGVMMKRKVYNFSGVLRQR